MASEAEDTDTKLAILASLFPLADSSTIFEVLIEAEGSVDVAIQQLKQGQTSDNRERGSGKVNSQLRAPVASSLNNQITATANLTTFENDQNSEDKSVYPRHKRERLATTASPGQQTSIRRFHAGPVPLAPIGAAASRKGRTLHLYDAESVAAATPCSIIYNFLPQEQANSLLKELLAESSTFGRAKFQLFERTVSSPHSSSFYVGSAAERNAQLQDYVYNGAYLEDVRWLTPELAKAAGPVEEAVNREIDKRIRGWYPDGKKLRFQSGEKWRPNCAFVNCYNGAKESVGAHADQLTYIGPRAVIGSLSLGVEREFRVRKIVPKEDPTFPESIQKELDEGEVQSIGVETTGRPAFFNVPMQIAGVSDSTPIRSNESPEKVVEVADGVKSPQKRTYSTMDGDATPSDGGTGGEKDGSSSEGGQIAIHLPHNSLLVMHAEMQEEWKHAIAPAPTLTPHPIAGVRRINVTYRWYRPEFHPRYTPRCACAMPAVLRCVQRRQSTHGRYMWMCHVHYTPGQTGCSFFRWADFDDDGRPEWAWLQDQEGEKAIKREVRDVMDSGRESKLKDTDGPEETRTKQE